MSNGEVLRQIQNPSSARSDAFGLHSWRCLPEVMALPHRHTEIEINLLLEGEIVYAHRDRLVRLWPGRLAIFWAAVPHQLVERPLACDSCIFTIPLEMFLGWKLPAPLVQDLLAGEMVIDPDASSAALDVLMLPRWHIELSASSDPVVVLKEMEARLWRLALRYKHVAATRTHAEPHSTAEKMAQYIVAHYQASLTVEEVAGAVGLHPNYATTSFKRTFGMTIWEYTLQYRVTQAQRLLVTTDASVLDVAMQSGFGSLSSFYAAFQRYTGRTPKALRQAVHSGVIGRG
ncbi:MAG: AraC family transcriptional regulator [Caldilinea sp.]